MRGILVAARRRVAAGVVMMSVAACGSPSLDSDHWMERGRALDAIDDPVQLTEILLTRTDLPLAAVNSAVDRIGDQALLDRIARNASDESVRGAACYTIVDDRLQFELAKTLEMWTECAGHALNVIDDDQDLLVALAEEASDRDMRERAIDRLTDLDHLARFALRDDETYLDQRAQTRLAEVCGQSAGSGFDYAAYFEALAEKGHRIVPEKLVACVDDPAALHRLASLDAIDSEPRQQAVARIDNQQILASLASGEGDTGVRRAALAKIDDTALLTNIALNAADAPDNDYAYDYPPSHDLRARAVRQLQDQSALRRVAVESTEWRVRATALSFIEDQAFQAEAAANGRHQAERLVATARVRDTGVLRDLRGKGGNRGALAAFVLIVLEELRPDLPTVNITTRYDTNSQGYGRSGANFADTLATGEKITVSVGDGQSEDADSRTFATNFPDSIPAYADESQADRFYPAKIMLEGFVPLLTDVLRKHVPEDARNRLAGTARAPILRAAAIATASNERLAGSAMSDSEVVVRRAAIERLTDQARLARFAREDPDFLVRRMAVMRLTDEATLVEIREGNDPDWTVRSAARDRLNELDLIQ